jgi:hypothetical protein
MKELKDYLNTELSNINRSIVATPDSMDHLEMFAKANHGSSDMLLMQMAINYGYKIAMQNVQGFIDLQS